MELGRSGPIDDDVGIAGRGGFEGEQRDRQILQHLRWGARLCSRRAAPGAALNDQRNLVGVNPLSILTRAREAGRRDAIVGKQGGC